MITEKEYFLLALLAYCDFSKKHIGKNLWKIWEEEKEKKTFRTSFTLLQSKFYPQFMTFFEEELKKWFIIRIDNRKAKKISSSQSGFFSVCFGNSKQGYVISYRGSEVYPLEDAYQDFINTDLTIGMGKIPIQFHEGIEVVEKLVQDLGLKYPQISLTGHSLGGGIAQYVAFSLHNLHQYIPITYTWNAVGITHIEELSIQKIKRNIDYQKKIVNYGHSEDFTNSLFSHIGKQYFVDRKLSSKRINHRNFLEKIPFLKKSLSSFHCENVFLPFFGEGKSLQKKVCLAYLAAACRKLIMQEKLFSKDFLADYYLQTDLSKITLEKYRRELIEALKKYTKALYCKQIIEQLEDFSPQDMQVFWKEFLRRIASPYRYLDVFDILVYEYI